MRDESLDGRVVEGRDGRLFLGSLDSFSLRAFVAGRSLTPEAIARWRLTVRRRAAALAARGIPYVFYIVPDAPSVYPEDLPSGLVRGTPPGRLLAAALQDIPNLTIIYPLDELVAAKGGLPTFRKTDTHWSGFGAFVAYQAVCRSIAGLVPFDPLGPRDVSYAMQREFGDLGSLATPERAGSNPALRIGRSFSRGGVLPGPFRNNSQIFHAEHAPPARVLILRDSFMTEQAPLMAATFGTTEMVGTTSRLFLEHVDASRPALVMTEICERRLTEWENDHQLQGFDEMFATDWVTDVGRVALAAEMALQRGQPDAIRQAGAALAAQEAAWTDGHAFVAARASLALGELPAAQRSITRALAEAPDRVAVICVAAQVRFAQGDGEGAMALAARAMERAPWNGYVHELRGYFFLACGRTAEALQVFAAATATIDDHPHLYFLASLAAEREGDVRAAADFMAQGLMLWPDNADYKERLARLGPIAPAHDHAA